MKEKLLKKIEKKQAVVGIMGMGYVGLPLAVECAKKGFLTIGLDPNREKIQKLAAGQSYIDDVPARDLEELLKTGQFLPTADFQQIAKLDIIFICVPTPLDKHSQPDTNYIVAAGQTIADYLQKEAVVILESTTYPGTTRELLKPLLEENGLVCNQDFYLGFSPERIDPGNIDFTPANTPKIVSGLGDDAAEVIAAVYNQILDSMIHKVSSPEIAEMEKILENTYRNINIGMINELAIFCEKMNINIWEVIEAAKTKPYGFQAFYPGPGLGGHCIPLDPYYLTWKAKEYDFHTSMIENSMRINDFMPEYTTQRIAKLLNRHGSPLKDTKILLLGIAYKPNISDYRESPALEVAGKLHDELACVDYYDPYIPACEFNGSLQTSVADLSSQTLAAYDLVVITTAHSTIDYTLLQKNAKFIFDTRNATATVTDKSNIELL